MRNQIILSVIGFILLTACTKEDDNIMTSDIDAPKVTQNAAFEVLVTENINYAEGLSHDSLNSINASAISLLMDSYVPDNNLQNRPLLMLIHGGGFTGGTKQQEPLVDMANYYASRGFVVFSIDYRLRGDKGTVPQDWIDASSDIAPENHGQFFAIYPAHRDAKAALRWIVTNADDYHINRNYITVGGGSAGATTSIGIAVSDLNDYKDELSIDEDATLLTTNPDQTYEIKTILDFWGSDNSIEALELIYGYQRFDQNTPAIFIAHGTEDTTVPFSNADDLKTIYEINEANYVYYPLEGRGHGAWNATVGGKSVSDLSFEFIADEQNLIVE
jgi:dipeptidyl aminopeptidase/acylaminoacyl peptidase